MQIEVITGFGYYTETATGHIIAKAALTAGVYDIASGYTYTEVEDQTALDAIEIYQAPPNDLSVDVQGCVSTATEFYAMSMGAGAVQETAEIDNSAGAGFMIVQGFMTVASLMGSVAVGSAQFKLDTVTPVGSGEPPTDVEIGSIVDETESPDGLTTPFTIFVPKGYYLKISATANNLEMAKTTISFRTIKQVV